MRLMIDFGAPQDAPSQHTATLLALARTLLAAPGQHAVHVAVSGRHPTDIDVLRHALGSQLAADRFHVVALPGATDDWRRHAAGVLRDGFFAALSPTAVLRMGQADMVEAHRPGTGLAPMPLLAADASDAAGLWRAVEKLATMPAQIGRAHV